MSRFIILILLFAAKGVAQYTGPPPPTKDEIAQTLYVKSVVANLRSGPSTSGPILLQLKAGHKLMEISRKGNWIEVGAAGTGKIGWIYKTLLTDKMATIEGYAVVNDAFKKFKLAFDDLNQTIKRTAGFTFFTEATYLGDGIIQITATDVWLSAPYSDRTSGLQTVYDMWEAADGTGLSIAVYVVDSAGIRRMTR